ncbi:Ubiquitin-conjugating enzyme [Macleaya cordata]|uniref:E2 ubiquitin-conjugating enzyme n=1 Tax=Macleaya cordata TaxID=56857 RepID=A0A200QWS6_MACCD|nr:Ubiquitin-conjugating enzyme [Macleaya cordata]
METPPYLRYVNRKSKIQFYPPNSSRNDVEVIDVMEASSSSSSSNKKLKQIQVVPDIIDIDGDDDPAGVLFIGEKFSTDNKGKATRMEYDNSLEDSLVHQNVFPTSAAAELMSGVSLSSLKSLETEFEDPDDLDDVTSDFDMDAASDDYDFIPYDETLHLQAQFDAVDLPPDCEASIPLFPWLENPASSQKKPASTSSFTVSNQLSSCNGKEDEEDEALMKFRLFKQFDTVQDFSDHHYVNKAVSKSKKAPLKWTKTIQQEWKILKKDLPDAIFVRVYEERMDLLRAVIIGAAGTPYHDGLFFFDIYFPSDYPDVPPEVYYHSGGLRLNPNLYNCGKVCLSLLNTWPGDDPTQKWTPGKSTILQVLLSIQALVLNAKPYFNEPGYERSIGKKDGEKKAQDYNENTFILSCKTMLYTLRRPPKHFEDFIVGHFRTRAYTILVACKAYIEGAQVGCVVGEGVQDVDEGDKSGSVSFKSAVGSMAGSLVPAFIQNGAKDCEQFIPLGDGFRLTQANYTNILRPSFYKQGEAVVGTSTDFNS